MRNYLINKNKNYKPELDGLRAFAIIAVIINHINKDIFPYGYLGVDMFFVISGYVITSSIAERNSQNFYDFIFSFYVRRIKRLIPGLIFFVLTTSIFICFFSSNTQTILRTGISSLFGLSNLYLLKQSTDYFAQSSELNVFTHTWSLGVEEQFYLIFPFIVWFSGFGQKSINGSRNLFLFLIFLSSISLISFAVLYSISQSSVYFLMPFRFWEISIGCLLYLYSKREKSLTNLHFRIPPLIIILLMLGVFISPLSFPVSYTIIIVFLTAVLISNLKRDSFIFKIFISKSVTHIGLISYSLYLWHWGIISISRWTIGLHWWSIPFQLFLIFLLANFSYRYIESPFRFMNYKIKNLFFILLGFFSLFFSTLIIFLLNKSARNIYLGNKDRGYSEKDIWNRNSCKNKSTFGNYLPDEKVFDKCWFIPNKKILKDNVIKNRIFFYGNSYNDHLMPIPSSILQRRDDYKFNSYFGTNCFISERLRPQEEDGLFCGEIFRRYLDYFNKNSLRGDSLIIASNFYDSSFKEGKFFYNGKNINKDKVFEVYLKELKKLSQILNSNGRQLVVVSPIPLIIPNPEICVNYLANINKKCSQKNIFNTTLNNKIKKSIRKMEKLEDHGIIFLNIYKELEGIFEKEPENIFSYYSNRMHLTRKGAQKLRYYFESKVLDNHLD